MSLGRGERSEDWGRGRSTLFEMRKDLFDHRSLFDAREDLVVVSRDQLSKSHRACRTAISSFVQRYFPIILRYRRKDERAHSRFETRYRRRSHRAS
jgi:hypothetical protein